MRILLVCPAPPGSRLGNRITALRWQKLFRELGHTVAIVTGIEPRTRRSWDVLVALHARRSANAVRIARDEFPERRVVVVLTGTDLYEDIHTAPEAKRSLDLADRLVVLHSRGARELPRALRWRVHVVPQSAPPIARAAAARARRATFDVAVVGHLRVEKDPMRTAKAARLLPARSRIRVIHVGRALSEDARDEAIREARDNPRYTWRGEVSPAAARRLIADADVLSLTSVMEGGANVLSEAIAAGTPVIASRIECSLALLGTDYPALFRVGATSSLAALLSRVERDPAFLRELARRCRARRRLVSLAAERGALKRLLRDLAACPDRKQGPFPKRERVRAGDARDGTSAIASRVATRPRTRKE